MDLSGQRKLLIAAYIAYLAFYYSAMYLVASPLQSYPNTIGAIGNLVAFPFFWLGIKSRPPDMRRPWHFFALSAVLYFIGEIIWAYYGDFLGIEPESPSICDLFYITNTCTCLVGFVFYLWQSKVHIISASFDLLISVFAIGGILYYFTVLPILASEPTNLGATLILLFYPAVDLALFVGILLLVFGTENQRLLKPINCAIGLSFLVMFAIDELTMFEPLYGVPLGEWTEPVWTLCYVVLALASLYPDETEPTGKERRRYPPWQEAALEYGRMLLPYLFTFLILLLVGIENDLFNSFFAWAIFLVLLLSLRQILVLLRNKRLLNKIRQNEEKLNLQNIELHKLNQQIMHDAEIDFLTQLSNRRYIDKTFERLAPTDGRTESLGILLIDVDFFKRINDTFGHQKGDTVLQTVADSIRAAIRGGDIAGRFGGDEFIVLLPGADTKVAKSVAERLIKLVHENATLAEMKVSLSIGCTSLRVTQQSYDVTQLLRQADEALYEAKENGRDQYVICALDNE